MTRIAVVTIQGGEPWGGSEYLWAAMAEQALTEGHEVFISLYDWSLSHPIITQLQQQGAQLLPRPRFPKPSLPSRILKRLSRYIPSLQSFLSESPYRAVFDCKPDVICINNGSTYDAIFIEPDLLHLFNFSSVHYLIVCQLNHDNDYLDDKSRITARQFFAKAVYVAFVSQQNLRLAKRQLAQSIPNGLVVQNPVNLLDLSTVPWPEQSKICFASVARLDVANKGQEVLFEVLSLPTWQERDWQCNLYGTGKDQAYLEALAEHYGIAKRVNFKGHVKDIRAIWSENHLLVLSSRAEGTPLALVEAMICGRPSVVTDVGGNAEWVEDGKTGFIAEAPTAKSFSAALERAWLAQSAWKTMGITAHDKAVTKFDKSPSKSLLKLVLNAAR